MDVKGSQLLVNQRVSNSRFVVGNYVTGGSFGSLHIGIDSKNGQKVAIKMEKQDIDTPQLHLEFGFYRNLGTIHFVPKIFYFGACQDWSALVMELLGPSLFKMYEKCNKQFSIVTTTKLMLQLINMFEFVHEHGLLYRDIKPDNFLLGLPDTPKWCTVHIIDLGFCKKYVDEQNKHIEYKEGKAMTGTARYISVNNHMGRELSRRDDMEAITYMFVFLHKGQLPWQGVQIENIRERYRQIGMIKATTTPKELCSGMPSEYEKLLSNVKSLQFNERPRYRHLMSLFKNLLSHMGIQNENDFNWDWDKYHNYKG